MSLNREMLQVARLSPRVLGEAATLVGEFLQSLANEDGGYADREGKSDLYYTSFAVAGLVALQEDLPIQSLARYLAAHASGAGLDLVHLACLARVWSLLPPLERPSLDVDQILATVESVRMPDGGYNGDEGAKHGTLYGCFLALGLYEDLNVPMPRPEAMRASIHALRTDDGGYANSADMPIGLTTTSAAAASLLRHLGDAPDPRLAEWLLRQFHPEGGFIVTPEVPMPDLLSTATALHALATLKIDLRPIQEPCLDFIDTLWTARGGFYGSWEDDHLDCEYTYYGLLSLGHLSV